MNLPNAPTAPVQPPAGGGRTPYPDGYDIAQEQDGADAQAKAEVDAMPNPVISALTTVAQFVSAAEKSGNPAAAQIKQKFADFLQAVQGMAGQAPAPEGEQPLPEAAPEPGAVPEEGMPPDMAMSNNPRPMPMNMKKGATILA